MMNFMHVKEIGCLGYVAQVLLCGVLERERERESDALLWTICPNGVKLAEHRDKKR